jgi:hypothetical protein
VERGLLSTAKGRGLLRAGSIWQYGFLTVVSGGPRERAGAAAARSLPRSLSEIWLFLRCGFRQAVRTEEQQTGHELWQAGTRASQPQQTSMH